MPIEFPCPICHQQVRTPDAAAGKKGKCPNCGTLVLIPAPVVVFPPPGAASKPTIQSPSKPRPPDPARMPPGHDPPPPKPATPPPPAAPAGSIEFACPECHQTVRTPAAAAGKKGYCPHCHAVVQIPAHGGEPAPKTTPQTDSRPPAEGRKETVEKAAKATAPAAPAAPSAPAKTASQRIPSPSDAIVTSKGANAPHPEAPAPASISAKPAATPAKPAAPAKPAPATKHLPVAKALPTQPTAGKPAAKADPEILDLEELPADKQGTPGLTPLGGGLTPLGGGLTPLGPGPAPVSGLTPLGPAAGAISGLTPLGPAPTAPSAPDPLAGLTPLSAYPAVALPPPPNPLGGPASPFGPSANPYAAPAMSGYGQPAYQTRTVSDAHRRGLPWEREPSMEAFNDTMSLVLGSPQEAFSVMHRTGGVGNPIGFMIIGMVIGQIANAIYGTILSFIQAAASERPMNVEALILGGAFLLVGGVIGAVIFAPIMSFVIAGIYHLLLAMVGGANAGYEATFRSVCFVNGSTSILLAIPCIGPFLAFFFSIICTIHAFANAHETSGGKSAFSVLGVLFGLLVCGCGCGIMFILPAIAAAMNQLP